MERVTPLRSETNKNAGLVKGSNDKHLYTLNKRNCVSQNTPIRVQSKKIAKLPFNLYMLRAGSMVFRTCGRSDQARKSTFFNRSARLKAC